MCEGREIFQQELKKMKLSAMQVLMKLPLSSSEFRVLMCVLSDAEEFDSSQEEIASKTGMPYETVKKALRGLIQAEYLLRLQIGKIGMKSRYKINTKALLAHSSGQISPPIRAKEASPSGQKRSLTAGKKAQLTEVSTKVNKNKEYNIEETNLEFSLSQEKAPIKKTGVVDHEAIAYNISKMEAELDKMFFGIGES